MNIMITRTFTIVLGEREIPIRVSGHVDNFGGEILFVIDNTEHDFLGKERDDIDLIIYANLDNWEDVVTKELCDFAVESASTVFVDKAEYDDHMVEG